ncbi:MAG: Ig-like domain-containing protein [Planctomycetota bacterium]|jgi:hypothetical protein
MSRHARAAGLATAACIAATLALPAAGAVTTNEVVIPSGATPPGWSIEQSAGGVITQVGIDFDTSDKQFYYARSFPELETGDAFVVEAIVSTSATAPGTENGARLAIDFKDEDTGGDAYRVEVRFERDAGGVRHVRLYWIESAVANLELDLSPNDFQSTSPRLRVRVRRQQIGGVDHLFLEVEPSRVGGDPSFEDPAQRNATTTVQPLRAVVVDFPNVLLPETGGHPGKIRFGHGRDVGSYQSAWESVHYTFADTVDGAPDGLPYWPPGPPAPSVVHDEKGMYVPQGVDVSADCSATGYLTNDTVTAELDADATTYTGDARTPPGNEAWDFDSLGDNQTVFGRIAASDVSGRTTIGPDGSAAIPNRIVSGVMTNEIYAVGSPMPPGWSLVQLGVGTSSQAGVTFDSNDRSYFYTQSFGGLETGNAWVVEALVSAPPPGVGGENGGRLGVYFKDPATGGDTYKVEVRFENDAGLGLVMRLYDVAGGGAALLATLANDFTTSSPRFRVRLRRQQIGGQECLFLEAEPSSGFEDPAQRGLATDAAPVRAVVVDFPSPMLPDPGGEPGAVQFGNFRQTGTYSSDWESIHVTFCDDATTLLPYWPPAPPAPSVVHDDKGMGVPQGVDVSGDCSGTGYLVNDAVTAELDADATTYTGDARTPPGNEAWDFDSLGDNQAVAARLVATEVSGRSAVGADGNATIPDRTVHVIANDIDVIGTPVPPDWTEQTTVGGTASRTDIHITSQLKALYYNQFFPQLGAGNAFVVEAVVSVTPQAPGASDETSDARMVLHVPDLSSGDKWVVEVRFVTNPAGVTRIALFDIANAAQTEMASLERDFSVAPDRTRVRIRRQEIGGTDYLFLEAEPETTFEDKTRRSETTDIPNVRAVMDLATFGMEMAIGPGEIRWGHTENLKNSESWWESIHVTFCDNKTTLLPYWPPAPPAPTVVHDDKGSGLPQGVDVSADCSGTGYLVNDAVTAELDADATTYTGDARTPPGNEAWDFDSLGDDQSVAARLVATEVAGRSTSSAEGGTSIPDRTGPVVSLETPDNASFPPGLVTLEYNVTDSGGGVSESELYVDGSPVQTDTTVTEGVTQSFTVTLAAGMHTWRVEATDDSTPPNTGTSETRTVRAGNPGDLNFDGTVDQADVDIISANAGLNSSHAAWDQRCDPDGNGVCNLDDLMTVFRNWGEVY